MQDMKTAMLFADKLKALANPHRLCIVQGLIENECNVSRIQECLRIPQSTISQHLARLRAAKIIEGHRKGLEVCYKVIDAQTIALINALFPSVPDKQTNSRSAHGNTGNC